MFKTPAYTFLLKSLVIIVLFQVIVSLKIFHQNSIAKILLLLDEVYILLIFLFIALYKIHHADYQIRKTILLLFMFISASFTSYLNNIEHISVIQMILGMIEQVKYILPFFVILYVNRECGSKKIKFLLFIENLLLIIMIIGLIQEALALAGIIRGFEYRYGIYRVYSVLNHPITFGTMSVLYLVFQISKKKINKIKVTLAILCAIFSVSRIAYLGLICVIFQYLSFRFFIMKERYLVPFILFPIIAGIYLFLKQVGEAILWGNSARLYFIIYAFNIFKSNILFGTGPGTFGTKTSFNFNSWVYNFYEPDNNLLDWAFRKKSFDTFLPTIFVETGILGFLAWSMMILMIYLTLKNIKGSKLHYFIPVFIIMCISNYINSDTATAFIFFIYCAICLNKEKIAYTEHIDKFAIAHH